MVDRTDARGPVFRDERRDARRLEQRGLREIFRARVARTLSREHPDADAARDRDPRFVDPAFLQPERARDATFVEGVGVIAGAERAS
ncbi:MAG: hypothetical protein NVSMB21_20500 [Vulcanimicrobiaceae bacterium]